MASETSNETRIFYHFFGKEFESPFSPISNSKGCFSKWLDKNHDVVCLITSVIFATFAILIAFGIIPVMSISPMFLTGFLAAGAGFAAMIALMTALRSRGCIVIRKENTLEAIES